LQAQQNQRLAPTDFAAPVFGIKAKQVVYVDRIRDDFAAPVFGIKAKLDALVDTPPIDFAAPVFGIKAKLARQT
jgi:hypothetical protein